LRGKFFEHCKRPKVRVELVDRLAPLRDSIKASTDSSDGLALSLFKIAKASGVRIRLESPPPGPLGEKGFYGGEEYLPVLVVERDSAEEVARLVGGKVVGFVEEGEPTVLYKGKELSPEGWEWF
jgi:thiamine-monophosphate kinase